MLCLQISYTDNTEIALFTLILGSDMCNETTTLTLWDNLALKFHNLIEEDEEIVIQGFETSQRNRFHSSTLPFILKLYGSKSDIHIVPRSKVIPMNRFSFIKIKELKVLPPGTEVDVIGIIATVEGVREVTTASGSS